MSADDPTILTKGKLQQRGCFSRSGLAAWAYVQAMKKGFTMKGEVVIFEVEYRERVTGRMIVKDIVADFRAASEMARTLAMAHGRMAKIRRKGAPKEETWSAVLVPTGSNEPVQILKSCLSRRDAIIAWREWDHNHEGAVLVIWPDSEELPEDLLKRAG